MRVPGYGLPRTLLPRTQVNREKKKGAGLGNPGPFLHGGYGLNFALILRL